MKYIYEEVQKDGQKTRTSTAAVMFEVSIFRSQNKFHHINHLPVIYFRCSDYYK